MKRAATIGLDIAKDVFQAHGADKNGETVFNRKLRRSELLEFFQNLPKCTIGIEACGTAHHWARSIKRFGHDVRLIHPLYVKPFVKRDKTDANDAEAINEALTRKTMRFVAIKSAEQQAAALSFRLRSLLIRQRAQMANSLRSHLAEFGIIIAGSGFVRVTAAATEALGKKSVIPREAHAAFNHFIDQIKATNDRILQLERQILDQAKHDETIQRLMTIPGVGPMVATAITSMAPSASTFRSARHFAAWVGLTPRNYSSGGIQVLGHVTKMGNGQLRALLVTGAISVLNHAKAEDQRPSWLIRLKRRRPYKVAAVALANKIARVVWAILMRGGTYEASRGDNLARSPV
ncbi:IS110 family transposase [Rhizobium sp. 16-449-1b]|uniref:IS110 family transposase n=1 Tax=Rhizobium sp. 16-449-1b TaxID=2819989 RepID=UPI001AD98893|nr:IS110 family transposase [Rhizobium sp. 16-449-1b]MBO9198188.1 IS110 family transposase [Rhizobium sp. 16-449-1b]